MILVAFMLMQGTVPDVATAETMVSGGFTIIMLHLWARCRQLFYLNEKPERGFHWRASLLQFAKWPYQLAAVVDVLANRQFPYVTTPKTAGPSRPSFVLWPHVTTLAVIGSAWGMGLAIHETIPVSTQICAGMVVVVTLGLMATDWRWVSRRIIK
jgi:hypothetical protein